VERVRRNDEGSPSDEAPLGAQ